MTREEILEALGQDEENWPCKLRIYEVEGLVHDVEQRTQSEITKLREALEWYADEKNYWAKNYIQDLASVQTDKGQKARAALGMGEG